MFIDEDRVGDTASMLAGQSYVPGTSGYHVGMDTFSSIFPSELDTASRIGSKVEFLQYMDAHAFGKILLECSTKICGTLSSAEEDIFYAIASDTRSFLQRVSLFEGCCVGGGASTRARGLAICQDIYFCHQFYLKKANMAARTGPGLLLGQIKNIKEDYHRDRDGHPIVYIRDLDGMNAQSKTKEGGKKPVSRSPLNESSACDEPVPTAPQWERPVY